jgi:hypothetical protein
MIWPFGSPCHPLALILTFRVRRLTLFVVLVAFVFSCGGQWPVLQCVAWVNMVREYSEMVPLTRAVQMTFSGQYPCALCKAIADRKRSEYTKTSVLFQHEKKILSAVVMMENQRTTVTSQVFDVPEQFLSTRSESPPTPPPRPA